MLLHCSLIPRPHPAFRCLQYVKAGRAWYLFSREHDVINKWQKKKKIESEKAKSRVLLNQLQVQLRSGPLYQALQKFSVIQTELTHSLYTAQTTSLVCMLLYHLLFCFTCGFCEPHRGIYVDIHSSMNLFTLVLQHDKKLGLRNYCCLWGTWHVMSTLADVHTYREI